MSKSFVKRIRVTEEYVVTCKAGSTSTKYVERDATHKVQLKVDSSRVEEILEDWHEMTPLEETLMGAGAPTSRYSSFERA